MAPTRRPSTSTPSSSGITAPTRPSLHRRRPRLTPRRLRLRPARWAIRHAACSCRRTALSAPPGPKHRPTWQGDWRPLRPRLARALGPLQSQSEHRHVHEDGQHQSDEKIAHHGQALVARSVSFCDVDEPRRCVEQSGPDRGRQHKGGATMEARPTTAAARLATPSSRTTGTAASPRMWTISRA